MPTRRSLLMAGAALMAAPPALAQRRTAAPHGRTHAGPAEAVPTGTPAQTPIGPFDTAAKWAFVVDHNTGAELLNKDADVRMPPSSMTKLMTAYLVYDQLRQGRLQLDQMLPVSERAWRMQGSKMFVPYPGQVAVKDLILGMIVQSGNDACIVLAEAVAGSEEEFVALMNKKAGELGLTNSNFRNCTGWPDSDHYMSCRDIATLASRLIRDFPEDYKYDSVKEFVYNNIKQGNRNTLVQKGIADGLKTGHTDAGGFGIVASAERGGRRTILVLNGMDSMHQRSEEGERVLEWSFGKWENVTLFQANVPVDSARVYLGTQPSVPLVGAEDLVVTMPRGWRNSAQVSIQYDAPLTAPVRQGTECGKLVLSGNGVPHAEVKLLTGADVPRLGLPSRAVAVLTHYITGS